MSSPATPPSSANLRTAFAHAIPERAKSLDLQTSPIRAVGEERNYASRFVARPRAVDLSSGMGFSVSGETELRMALARRNTIGGSATHPEYKFEFREKERCSGVRLTAKKFGQGLRNMLMLRRAMSPPP